MTIKVQPKNIKELVKIIEDTIKKEGSNCNLNFIDTSCIKDMSYLFSDNKFNGDISKWNIQDVFDITFMFMNSKFSNNISKWNTRNVKLKLLCFEGCPLENNHEFQPTFKIN